MSPAGRTIKDALREAVEKSGKLDALLLAPQPPRRDRTRSRARRAEARKQQMDKLVAEARRE